jgi:hypothetical protein
MPFIQKLRAHVAKTFKVFDGKCQVFIPAEKTDAKNPKWYVQLHSVYFLVQNSVCVILMWFLCVMMKWLALFSASFLSFFMCFFFLLSEAFDLPVVVLEFQMISTLQRMRTREAVSPQRPQRET